MFIMKDNQSHRILGIGDPHLEEISDIGESFEHKVKQIVDKRDIDTLVTVGDVIDPLPIDRTREHIEVGHNFYSKLDSAEVPVLAVGGNHDYDIHSEITEGHQNVCNLNYGLETVEAGERTVSFVGRGATQFDLGPEMDPSIMGRYDTGERNNLDRQERQTFENEVVRVLNGNFEYNELEEFFEVDSDNKPEFRNQVDNYRSEYEKLSNLLDSTEGDHTVIVDHNPPYNTSIDESRDGSHNGSLVNKNLLDTYRPEASIFGHLHDGGIDYNSQDDEVYLMARLGKRQLSILDIDENGSTVYKPLNEPDI